MVNQNRNESLVKGYIVHSDGLMVLLFSTDESLSILGRARTIPCDGTFLSVVFVVSVEFCENSVVPVAFGLLSDNKRYNLPRFLYLIEEGSSASF